VDGDGSVSDDGVPLAGVLVRAYRDDGDGTPGAGDIPLPVAFTDAFGQFSFTGLTDGTYWVAVDSRTITPATALNSGAVQGDTWAEQTYGGVGRTIFNIAYFSYMSAGPHFGGLRGDVSDAVATLGLVGAEHVIRASVAGAPVSGADFGFSFNVVTRAGDGGDDDPGNARTVQGTLRQFIQNANAISSGNTMRFVPAVATNASGGGGSWWRVSVTAALPALTDAGTVLEGMAFDSSDGSTVRDENPGLLGAGGTVGVDALMLSPVPRPELEIVDGGEVVVGLSLNAANLAVRHLGLLGFDVNIQANAPASGALIERCVVGAGASAFTDPGLGARSGINIEVNGADNGRIENNLLGFGIEGGIYLHQFADNWQVRGNEIRSNALGDTGVWDGVSLEMGSSGTLLRGNLIVASLGVGIETWQSGGSFVIENNTITGNGIGTAGPGQETSGVSLYGTGSRLERNIISGNAGPGVLVQATSTGNTLTANSIFDNGTIGIDLLTAADNPSQGTPPYVTPNDGPGDLDIGGNNLQNFPVLNSASTNGSQITIGGALTSTASTQFRLEFFANIAADPSGYGEGQRYLGAYTVTTNASGVVNFNVALTASVGGGEWVSATATDPSGNTSEFSLSVRVTGPFVVNVTTDASDADLSDDVCATGVPGECSLRAAIQQANATAGANTIHFDIPGAGPHFITPASALPAITGPVTIDGTSEPDFAGTPVIALDGNDLAADGLVLASGSGGSTIRGLVIRDFFGDAIEIQAGSNGNTIVGNYLGQLTPGGTDAGAGEANFGVGVYLFSSNNVIGGPTAADRNVISGNNQGIRLNGGSANIVQGNLIGTDLTATTLIGNLSNGIWINASSQNTIGGVVAGAGNVIGGSSGQGILLFGASNNVIQGNAIGTNASGAVNFGNGQHGIAFINTSSNNSVGGAIIGAGNIIAFNALDGVSIFEGTNNAVLGNSIYSNGDLGIDLWPNGVTPNDGPGDPDTGPNNLQNFPVLTSASTNGSQLTIGGALTSTASTQFRLEFFANIAADPSGYGEGQRYLGAYTVTTSAGGVATFSTTLAVTVATTETVSATATDPNGNTSEFSAVITPTPAFVVNVTTDAPDANTADGICQTAVAGQCSLRAAIQQANATAGANSIHFNIPLTDPNYNTVIANAFVIQPSTALPGLNDDNTTIDGATQEIYQGDQRPGLPDIVIDGINAGPDAVGLTILSNGNIIRKLDIRRFNNGAATGAGTGLVVDGGDNNTITDSYFTLNSNTTGGGGALEVRNSADALTLTGNTFSGNFSDGVSIIGGTGHSLTNNAATNNGEDGFTLGGTGLIFTANIASNNGPANPLGCGVELHNGVTNSSFSGNTVTGNGGRGGFCLINVDSTNNVIGPNNLIIANAGPGISLQVAGALNNRLTQNMIAGNAGLGIDLGNNGVTPNDGPGDPDTGPNNLQNFPVLTSASTNGSQLTIGGALTSTASTQFRLEFFANIAADPSGYGEGQRYLGAYTVTTSAGGVATFSTTLAVTVATTETVSATATDPNGNTSEFSAVITPTPAFVVNVTTDAPDANTADGICQTAVAGQCSLRAAIQQANATAGANTIHFNIPGAGPHIIAPASALPTIIGPVTIDATSEPDFVTNGNRPIVVVAGTNAGLLTTGFVLDTGSSGSVIRGLVIRDWGGDGIEISAGSSNNLIAGNYIGRLTTSGTAAPLGTGNDWEGITIYGANNTIGGITAADRNVISGNADNGFWIEGPSATGNRIIGNYIGVAADGTTALANGESGIYFLGGANNNTVGGLAAAERNVISGNAFDGLAIDSSNNIIQGNYIGVDATGAVARANGSNGIYIFGGSGNVIGGTAAGAGNVISANGGDGISIFGSTTTGTLVQGNSIGVAADGLSALGNADSGVYIESSSNHTVGGATTGAGNIIANNSDGVVIVGSGAAAIRNRILGNSIYANTYLGVDLNNNGVTPNDGPGDPDTGPNNLQNFPVLTAAVTTAGQLTVTGTLTSTANTQFRLEFFANFAADPSGYGEGQRYLGAYTVTTSAGGVATFSTTLTATVATTETVSATATDPNGNTSEFGPNVAVTYPFMTREPVAITDCIQVDYAAGTATWTSPENAHRSDNAYATTAVEGTTSEYLYCRNFGFSLPAGAVIRGIVVDIERRSDSTSDGGSRDASVRLVNAAGTPVGNNGATTTIYTTSDLVEAHGGLSNLWGVSWTAADINDADFGVVFAVTKPNPAGPAHTIWVDHIRITVYYSP
jgi:CSLREA domain-containing protein